jgi:predicted XRE-type DNA-binding protein
VLDPNLYSMFIDDPVEASRANLKAKLAVEFVRNMQAKKMTQKETADLMGVSQARISDLARGKLDRFSIDMLCQFMLKWGYKIEVQMHGFV